jgi:cell division topological specificity factor
VFEFIQRFFGKPTSSATAKERLRLVLLSDHLSLAPDVVEALKHDLIEVISRYVDVDALNCDVTFEQQEKQVAMLANIPILGMRSRPTPPRTPPPAPPPAPEPELELTPSLDAGGATASVAAEPEPEPASAPAQQPQPQARANVAASANAAAANAAAANAGANGRGKRRRRRQSTGSSPAASPVAPGFSGI